MSAQGSTIGARIGRNTGLLVGGRAVSAVLSLVALGFATRGLTPAEFGSLVFLHALVVFFTQAATFQSWRTVVRYGAAYRLAGDEEGFGRVVRFSVALDAASSLVAFAAAAAVCAAAAGRLSALSGILLAHVLGYLTLILLKQTSASLGVIRLLGRFELIAAEGLVTPALRVAGGAWVLWSGGGLGAFLLVWYVAGLASYAVLPVAAWGALGREGLRAAVASGPLTLREPTEGAWRFAWLTNADLSLATMGKQVPLLLTGIVFGPVGAALYRIGQEVASVLAKGSTLLDQVIYPELATLVASGQGHRIALLTARAGAALLGVGAVVSAAFWAAGPPLLATLLGRPAYAEAAGVSVALLLAAALGSAVAPLFPGFYATGHPLKPMIARAVGIVATLGAFWPLSRALAVEGAALSVLLGSAATVAAGIVLAARHDWTQAADSASRTSDATSPTVADRSGGPGHAASRRS